MSLSNIRAITNFYPDARLLSLRAWKRAVEFEPRDQGGPYVVSQEGYDPADFKMQIQEFVLGRSGQWLGLGEFFKLSAEIRREEFIFGTAAEVIEILDSLPGRAQVRHGEEADQAEGTDETHELSQAIEQAKKM